MLRPAEKGPLLYLRRNVSYTVFPNVLHARSGTFGTHILYIESPPSPKARRVLLVSLRSKALPLIRKFYSLLFRRFFVCLLCSQSSRYGHQTNWKMPDSFLIGVLVHSFSIFPIMSEIFKVFQGKKSHRNEWWNVQSLE